MTPNSDASTWANDGPVRAFLRRAQPMTRARAVVCLAASLFLAACAYVPLDEGAARRVSLDYTASGQIVDARAYVYGKHTILVFDVAPSLLLIFDESGAQVPFEKMGLHHRLARRLDKFTVWTNGQSVTFSATH